MGNENIFMLASSTDGLSDVKAQLLRDHCLFDVDKGYEYLEEQFDAGAIVQIVPMREGFMYPDFLQKYGDYATPLFVTVDSSVWLSEIVRYRRREILDRLRHCFGADLIKRVSYRAG